MNKKITVLARPLLAAGLLLLAARGASAAELAEGKQYKLLKPAQPTDVAPGKVGVVEVFWYACGHCYLLEPKLEAWNQKGKPRRTCSSMRMPATWNDGRQDARARVLHDRAARQAAAARPRSSVRSTSRATGWTRPRRSRRSSSPHGVSKAEFQKAFSSFAVESKVLHAEDLNRRYKITGTPTIVVNGKYITDVAMAGGEDQLFQVVNRSRHGRSPRR